MKRISLLILITCLSQVGWAANILKTQYLSLYRGEVRVLNIGDVDRVAVGNGKLLSTSITKKGQLIILAENQGETIIHVWGKTGWERELKVKIAETNPASEAREIRKLLEDSPNLTVKQVGGRTVIDGQAGPRDQEKLKAISKYYPNLINLTQSSSISREKMVHMQVQITEFSSSALEELGINWQTNINGPTMGGVWAPRSTGPAEVTIAGETLNVPAGVSSFGYFGIITSMTSRINLMEGNGDALILASPTLTARSGGEATFLAGGEIPLPSTNANGGSNVEFKEYGIKLEIKPTADDTGNITAHVLTELSAPDKATGVGDIPGFLSRRAETDLSLRDGETIVISGLMNSNLSKDVNRVKYLSSIPLLGALFRNTNTTDKKTELVIFVTPTIFDANSAINKESVAQHKDMIKRFRDAVDLKDWMKDGSANSDLLE